MYERKNQPVSKPDTTSETSRLKMAIAASIMLWCATPQQATADTNEEHAIEAVQQAKVKVKGTVVDETGEPMIGVAVKVLANNTGTITDLEGKFSVEAPLGGSHSNFIYRIQNCYGESK